MTVWVLIVLGFVAVGGEQVGVIAQARNQRLASFVFPTREACEAAREGVREFSQTANQTLLIGPCTEETR